MDLLLTNPGDEFASNNDQEDEELSREGHKRKIIRSDSAYFTYYGTLFPSKGYAAKLSVKQCSICLNAFGVYKNNSRNGLCCSGGHFVCTQDLNTYVEMLAKESDMSVLIKRQANIVCPQMNCSSSCFTTKQLRGVLCQESFSAFERSKKKAKK